MFVPLLIFASVACMGLFAALKPDAYTRFFLAESQRRALSHNLKVVSRTGWLIFAASLCVAIAIPFRERWGVVSPVLRPLFFLVCCAAYVWWGIGLVKNPESFVKRAAEPWNRAPKWAVKSFGALLLVGAGGFFYGFAINIRGLLR